MGLLLFEHVASYGTHFQPRVHQFDCQIVGFGQRNIVLLYSMRNTCEIQGCAISRRAVVFLSWEVFGTVVGIYILALQTKAMRRKSAVQLKLSLVSQNWIMLIYTQMQRLEKSLPQSLLQVFVKHNTVKALIQPHTLDVHVSPWCRFLLSPAKHAC